jgi:hypothetical protein
MLDHPGCAATMAGEHAQHATDPLPVLRRAHELLIAILSVEQFPLSVLHVALDERLDHGDERHMVRDCEQREPMLRTRHELSILRRQPDLLGMLVVTWLFNLAFGPVEVALPLFVTDDLHAGSELLGQYWAAFGIGAVIGALALGVARRLPLWPAMLAIIAGHGIGMLPFAVTHTAVPSLIGFAFAGLVYGPYSTLSFTVLQDRAPADSLTTVLAARSAVLLTASPLGAASGGFLVDLTSAPAVLTGCGGLMILIAVISAIMPKLYAVTGDLTCRSPLGRQRQREVPVFDGVSPSERSELGVEMRGRRGVGLERRVG